MPDSSEIVEAVIICTRNRPEDLASTLASLSAQANIGARLVVIVDASDGNVRSTVERIVVESALTGVEYVVFDGKPSLARQRNFAVGDLPSTVAIVHFFDDDVSLEAGYLDGISARFRDSSVAAAGGTITLEVETVSRQSVMKRFFLLGHPERGRVLVSGATTPAQVGARGPVFDSDWLSGCASSYRRDVFENHRCDPALDGYSLDEDLDLSYRVSRSGRVVVDPSVSVTHHESAVERSTARRMARKAMVHRYWFLEKNITGVLRKPAFWWATVGRLVALSVSREAHRRQVRRGVLEGIGIIWRRAHSLL